MTTAKPGPLLAADELVTRERGTTVRVLSNETKPAPPTPVSPPARASP